MKRLALLDRDGTLIEHIPYLKDPEQVRLLPGTWEGLLSLRQQGYGLVMVSNQSGVGRGYFGVAEVEAVNARMQELLGAGGVQLDLLLYCPHAPEAGCECRKPAPGMARQASSQLGVSLAEGLVVGDSDCDMGLAQQLGWPGFRLGSPDFLSMQRVAESLLS